MNLALLRELVFCHATPGEEDEVMALFARHCQGPGWQARAFGRYAYVVEQCGSQSEQRPRLLICAHADSPGFVVQSVSEQIAKVIALGAAQVPTKKTAAMLKTSAGKVAVTLEAAIDEENIGLMADYYCFKIPEGIEVQQGMRVAFAPSFKQEADLLKAPFFDNRAGCFLLCELFSRLGLADCACQVSLALSSAEEFTGFGAAVLAAQMQADLVICLDATYASKEQGVRLGHGPVLTLSDRTVLLSNKVKNTLLGLCEKYELPLQYEVYNFSGTDARAFPAAGSPALVLPLLIASEGNHSPEECISVKDLEYSLRLLQNACCDAQFAASLLREAFSWQLHD